MEMVLNHPKFNPEITSNKIFIAFYVFYRYVYPCIYIYIYMHIHIVYRYMLENVIILYKLSYMLIFFTTICYG